MSDRPQQKVALADVAGLALRGGDFVGDERFIREEEATFVPWGRGKFKPYEPAKPQDEEPTQEYEETHATAEAEAEPTIIEAPPALRVAPPPPPPAVLADPAPTPEEIIAAIETAREDGRGIGYKQGYDAAHREVADALHVLRKLASEMTMLADTAVEHNTEIIARHVRRIAQDLFGSVLADMPDAFVQRIKTAAMSFTKAGAEFTLALSPHDCLTLSGALRGEELFANIKIVDDEELQAGAFRLMSRDLEYQDEPNLSDDRAQA
jgi:flagellar biosynthesis/type III secretory pathway protein FliH